MGSFFSSGFSWAEDSLNEFNRKVALRNEWTYRPGLRAFSSHSLPSEKECREARQRISEHSYRDSNEILVDGKNLLEYKTLEFKERPNNLY